MAYAKKFFAVFFKGGLGEFPPTSKSGGYPTTLLATLVAKEGSPVLCGVLQTRLVRIVMQK
jgi:hypothetical protein